MTSRNRQREPLDAALRTALDAVRPDAAPDELREPELAIVARRLPSDTAVADALALGQRLDREVVAAMHDVPLPEGLAERLIRGLADVRPRDPIGVDAPTRKAPPATDDSAKLRRTNRRRWLWTAGICAATGLVAVGVWWYQQPRELLRPGQLLEAAIALYHEGGAEAPGESLATAPRGFPVSEDLFFDRDTARWRRWSQPLAERQVVAYDLERDGRIKATLLVLKRPAVAGLLDRPPASPTLPPTQGVCASAWESNGLVYVLIVHGGERDYQEFLRDAAGTIT